MFGLLEILIIAGVVMLFAGPAGVKKVIATAQTLRQKKAALSPRGVMKKILTEDEPVADDKTDAPQGAADAPPTTRK